MKVFPMAHDEPQSHALGPGETGSDFSSTPQPQYLNSPELGRVLILWSLWPEPTESSWVMERQYQVFFLPHYHHSIKK